MAYSKAQFKSNGDAATLCSRPFIIGNASHKCLPSELHYGFWKFSDPTWSDGRQLTVTQLVSFEACSSHSSSSLERIWYFFLWEDRRTMDLMCASCRATTLSPRSMYSTLLHLVRARGTQLVCFRACRGGRSHLHSGDWIRACYISTRHILLYRITSFGICTHLLLILYWIIFTGTIFRL